MKWMIAAITIVLQTAVVWVLPFMHYTVAIIALLGLSLFSGFLVQESREDWSARAQRVLSGFITGTYLSVVVISVAVYMKAILVN
jgi:membrane protein implicated in regulation of membrane protease activity